MTDITMRSNESCPFRARCYRATAKVNPLWQSWMRFDEDVDGCFEEIK
jgi:hypothetical protein